MGPQRGANKPGGKREKGPVPAPRAPGAATPQKAPGNGGGLFGGKKIASDRTRGVAGGPRGFCGKGGKGKEAARASGVAMEKKGPNGSVKKGENGKTGEGGGFLKGLGVEGGRRPGSGPLAPGGLGKFFQKNQGRGKKWGGDRGKFFSLWAVGDRRGIVVLGKKWRGEKGGGGPASEIGAPGPCFGAGKKGGGGKGGEEGEIGPGEGGEKDFFELFFLKTPFFFFFLIIIFCAPKIF